MPANPVLQNEGVDGVPRELAIAVLLSIAVWVVILMVILRVIT
jgi:hypothetical protein